MLHELTRPVAKHVLRMFEPLSFQASCTAVLRGICPGSVLVDDPCEPAAGCVVSPEAVLMAGNPQNDMYCLSLAKWLRDPQKLKMPIWHAVLVVSSDQWAERLSGIAGDYPVARLARRHYVCDDPGALPTLAPPAGVVVRRIDGTFLDDSSIAKPDHLIGWLRSNWGTRAHFLDKGFGVASVRSNEVVAWSIADCVVEGTCEIGIRTAPAWRRLDHCPHGDPTRLLQRRAVRGLALP